MTQQSDINRRIVLAARPQGAPDSSHFRLETQPVPQPAEGEILLRTVWLSLDPYMRGRMSDAPSYVPPTALGAVMRAGTIARVEQSRHDGFKPGEWVVSQSGWQDYALSDGHDLQRLPLAARQHPSWGLSLLGMTGFTAYMGLLDIGQPQAGETVVVAAASGAVGSVVGQIARLKGCHVVGIAGGAKKCRFAEQTLGFDRCLDHRDAMLASQLRRHCPDGIDVYFENVGGRVFDAVLPLMNPRGRIPLCGLIADYNVSTPSALADRLPQLQSAILRKRLRVQGFIITQDYPHRFGEFIQQMSQWIADRRILLREDIYQGLENAPHIFTGMLAGDNFGKVVVRVAPDEP
ncbi:NADP-dependent oxidoreductase [Erwinia sp. OLTSP20]|uniref:NADP-dependent oxidoreductase n=1 Tax=unclassified Erwinia TaxID=2622719 RepID=UPI000C18AAC2|nr:MULTISPECIES: NADP-dependent oxidoreductase [unclassified Erwinia]PIJ48728.1 NADP-dependent oxidoreductase [Erwinia sp. OAMSP11]PIJ69353.1 NADP-dependent oxidoreductase [Erwinia sp. OLSSP12]PIJ79187.1 NADP-dependent oxidoreductase [Erwinia sp. OLCASP19]PIJ80713.1 NADP-dependent oxidoreductase [Erwinia sp. OLMTSP26]PIJ82863.1 NADP-dependent oxidoreductase [Erwinia sp. OLMDSP33]